MVLSLNLRVKIVNAYLRYVDAQKARDGAEAIDTTTESVECNAQGGVMSH
jgi:hypothetical protein